MDTYAGCKPNQETTSITTACTVPVRSGFAAIKISIGYLCTSEIGQTAVDPQLQLQSLGYSLLQRMATDREPSSLATLDCKENQSEIGHYAR
jgi:hypothetical protein